MCRPGLICAISFLIVSGATLIFTPPAVAQTDIREEGMFRPGAHDFNGELVRFGCFTYRGQLADARKAVSMCLAGLRQLNKTAIMTAGGSTEPVVRIGPDKVVLLFWSNEKTGAFGFLACNTNGDYLTESGRAGRLGDKNWNEFHYPNVNSFHVSLCMHTSPGPHAVKCIYGRR